MLIIREYYNISSGGKTFSRKKAVAWIIAHETVLVKENGRKTGEYKWYEPKSGYVLTEERIKKNWPGF